MSFTIPDQSEKLSFHRTTNGFVGLEKIRKHLDLATAKTCIPTLWSKEQFLIDADVSFNLTCFSTTFMYCTSKENVLEALQ